MSNIIPIASSGLDAAVKRVTAAASNIANASTPDYRPVGVIQQANGLTGGVRADIAATGAQEVDLASEAVGLNQALNSYKANAAVIRVQDDLQRELLRDFRV